MLVAGYGMDSQHLVYTTSHLMTHAPIGDQDVALLAGRPGETGETVLRYASEPAVTVLAGSGVTSSWNAATGDLLIGYTHRGCRRGPRAAAERGDGPCCSCWPTTMRLPRFWRHDTPAGAVLAQWS